MIRNSDFYWTEIIGEYGRILHPSETVEFDTMVKNLDLVDETFVHLTLVLAYWRHRFSPGEIPAWGYRATDSGNRFYEAVSPNLEPRDSFSLLHWVIDGA